MSENSGIETPAAPEWLSKLENRRELLKRGKLGHEVGAGALCSVCGDKCPGLDLHFWRKVCRNCKCRKDQHMCSDDDLSGWAQFEILGQIRSKPAFIKIKALASQPVQLEWVPPNVAPDVISEYMEKLGAQQIPVAGSEAAIKRKQQLEFQVPPHDLDAALCDNLSETETKQLEQYVQRIRENCVGQGSVVRVGNINHAQVGMVDELSALANAVLQDPILSELLANEKLQHALKLNKAEPEPKLFVAFATPFSETAFEHGSALATLPTANKQFLRGLNQTAVQSLLQNAAVYDKIFEHLQHNNLDVSRDARLGPLSDFRQAYLNNPSLRQQIDAALLDTPLVSPMCTPSKNSKPSEFVFNSPLPVKSAAQTRMSAHMRQDTPMRKVRFNPALQQVLQACALPQQLDYEQDAYFADILAAPALKQALQGTVDAHKPLVLNAISPTPLDAKTDLSSNTKQHLNRLKVPEKALKSLLLNPGYYDNLFDALSSKHVDFSKCPVLAPLQQLRVELFQNPALRAELTEWAHKQPDARLISYDIAPTNLSNSKSNDSGFESKPTTPKTASNNVDVTAVPARFTSIPAIADMLMYPSVEASLVPALQQLQLQTPKAIVTDPPQLICRDCQLPIVLGDVAVKAERAEQGMVWHPACFKCHMCRELLADLVYFFHNGQVYCGRDLALKLKIPRCKACDELIFTKEYTAAEGASFHIKHFCCYHCDTPLAGQQYVPDEKTNMPLCLKCYEQYFAAACQFCKQFIGPADQGVALGDIHWHGSCFICAGIDCGKSLIGGRFCVKQKMPFCSPNCVRSIIH